MSIFRVILVRIQSECGKIRTRKLRTRTYFIQWFSKKKRLNESSETSSGKDFFFLFKTGWSHLISNLSFINNLLLLKSENKMSTYRNKWLDIADFLVFLITFSVWFEVPMSSDAVIKRMTEHFSLISNFSAAARITAVDYSREVLLFGGICESKQVTNSGSRYKTTLSLSFSQWCISKKFSNQKMIHCSFGTVYSLYFGKIIYLKVFWYKNWWVTSVSRCFENWI